MDHFNEARMLVSFGAARTKVFYLGAFGRENGLRNPQVADPNLGTLDDVRRCCYRALDLQVRKLATALAREARQKPAKSAWLTPAKAPSLLSAEYTMGAC